MSISPAQGIIVPLDNQQVEERSAHPPTAAPSTPEENIAQPDSGASSKTNANPAQNAAQNNELPEDEVQVQRDSQTNGDIVVKYVDHSGNLILQVPSLQVLGLARAIDQDFAREAKLHNPENASQDEGGKSHGD